MTRDFRKNVTSLYWSYNWNFSDEPVVRFTNPNVRTKVIYTLDELKKIISRSDADNSFIPVPRQVMESAVNTVRSQLIMKVQGSMAA